MTITTASTTIRNRKGTTSRSLPEVSFVDRTVGPKRAPLCFPGFVLRLARAALGLYEKG